MSMDKGECVKEDLMPTARLKSNVCFADFIGDSPTSHLSASAAPLLFRLMVAVPHRAIIAGVLWLLFMITPAWGAEAVELVVEGIDGAALANVREALALPAGLVSDGRVDMLWLERFAEMADEKALTALEPFGFYNARATVNLDKVGDGKYRLRLGVEPGKPVRVTDAHVGLSGPGAHERMLLSLVDGFPLKKGDVLLQQQYEEAKGTLMARRRSWGTWMLSFPVMKSASTGIKAGRSLTCTLRAVNSICLTVRPSRVRQTIPTDSCAATWHTEAATSFPIAG